MTYSAAYIKRVAEDLRITEEAAAEWLINGDDDNDVEADFAARF
jgi:hypothetical protein